MFVSAMCYCPEIPWKCRCFLFVLVTLSLFTSLFCKKGQIRIVNLPLQPHVFIQSCLFQTITLFLLRESVFSKTIMWVL